MDTQAKPPRTIQSIDRAVQIMELLAAESDGLSLKDLSQRMGLAPQTAQSLLRTLEHHRLVVQAGRGTPYALGPRLHTLSRKWMDGHDRASLAREAVERLARDIGEYVLLAELRGRTVQQLIVVRANQPLMVRPEVEMTPLLHTMATGKVLLAYLDAKAREAIIDSLEMKARGPASITDTEALRLNLAQIRQDAEAVCIEEGGVGIAGAAVPVRDERGVVIAALGFALPLARFSRPRRKAFLAKLHAAAHAVEEAWRLA